MVELKPLGLESVSIRPRSSTRQSSDRMGSLATTKVIRPMATKRLSVLVAGPRTEELLAERKFLAGRKLLA